MSSAPAIHIPDFKNAVGDVLRGIGAIQVDNLSDIRRAPGEGVGLSTDAAALDQTFVDAIVSLVPKLSGWQSVLGFSKVTRQGGKIGIVDNEGIMLQEGGENTFPAADGLKDDFSQATYATRKLSGKKSMTREMFRKAKEAGLTPEQYVLLNVTRNVANNLALLNIRGDTTLGNDTREKKLLRTNEGMLRLINANGVSSQILAPTTTTGKTFAAGVFDGMWDVMPEKYKHDNNLVWLMPTAIDSAWQQTIRNVAPLGLSGALGATGGSQGSAAGDRQLLQRTAIAYPYGLPGILVPQLPADDAGAVGVKTPTSVSGAGGNVAATVTTISASTLDGRKCRVKCLTTGVETIGSIVFSGGVNVVTITGAMGQSTISTTAADYEVSLADMTKAILTAPFNFHVVVYDEVRVYYRFNAELERFEIIIHLEHDIVMHRADAVVMAGGIITPKSNFFTT